MIEALLATFVRSVTWTIGKQAGRQLFRRLGWMVWLVVLTAAFVAAGNHYGWTNLWLNSLRFWLSLSAGLLPPS